MTKVTRKPQTTYYVRLECAGAVVQVYMDRQVRTLEVRHKRPGVASVSIIDTIHSTTASQILWDVIDKLDAWPIDGTRKPGDRIDPAALTLPRSTQDIMTAAAILEMHGHEPSCGMDPIESAGLPGEPGKFEL